MKKTILALSAAVVMIPLVAENVFAADKTFKVGNTKLKVLSVTGTRSFSYTTDPVDDYISTGSETWPVSLASFTPSYSGAKIFLDGEVTHSLRVNLVTGEVYDSCDQAVDVTPFGSSVSLLFIKRGRRYTVTATFASDPSQPSYEEALNALCPNTSVGIRANLMKAAETGEPDDACDGSEFCITIPASRLNAKRLPLRLSKTVETNVNGESATTVTDVTITLQTLKKKK